MQSPIAAHNEQACKETPNQTHVGGCLLQQPRDHTRRNTLKTSQKRT